MAEIGLGYWLHPSKGISVQSNKIMSRDENLLVSALSARNVPEKSARKEVATAPDCCVTVPSETDSASDEPQKEEIPKPRRFFFQNTERLAQKLERIRRVCAAEKSTKRKIGVHHLAVFVLGLLSAGGFMVMFQAMDAVETLLVDYDIDDPTQMQQIFHSGEPWLIYCVKDRSAIPRTLKDASRALTGQVNIGVLNCEKPQQANNLTISEEFGLTESKAPAFMVLDFEPPQQLPYHLYTARSVTKWARHFLKPTIVDKMNPEKFEKECIQQRNCMILGHRTYTLDEELKKDVKDLMVATRGLRVVAVDTSFWQLKLEDRITATRPRHQPRGVASLLCISKRAPLDSDDSDKVYVAGFFQGDLDDKGDLWKFMQECRDPSHYYGLVEVDTVPKLQRKQKKAQPSPAPSR